MKNTVTAEEILASLALDAEWMKTPSDIQKVLQPFIGQLPKLLADLLPKTVNLKQVLDAKIIFIRYCLENGLIAALAPNVRKNLKLTVTLDGETSANLTDIMGDIFDMSDMILDALTTALEQVTELSANLDSTLKDYGLTEREVLVKMGLSGTTLEKYDRESLTFADLLRTQPIVIVKEN